MSTNYAVEAHGLVKRYGLTTALGGIDVEVPTGTVIGVLGPNGAGKTTAVRILTTLTDPDEGQATVAGFDIRTQGTEVRRRIGLAAQDATVDPLLTGRENLVMLGELHQMRRSDAGVRATQLLGEFSLDEAADRVTSGYSGGMRRRLDLAATLVSRPEVLFLDEPTTGLDPMSRLNLWEEVRSLNHERGTTVFLTTQYLEEADQLAGRIAIIDGGRIVREGDPGNLKAAVGSPTLAVEVRAGEEDRVRQLLSACGEIRPSRPGTVAVGLAGGAADMAGVVRALDDAAVAVEGMELHQPTLDDVFADATGRRLEGAESH